MQTVKHYGTVTLGGVLCDQKLYAMPIDDIVMYIGQHKAFYVDGEYPQPITQFKLAADGTPLMVFTHHGLATLCST